MTYYHVFVAYKGKNGKPASHIDYNCSGERVKRIADPFMKNKKTLIGGFFIHPSGINRIMIWKSEKQFGDLILPNGKSAVDEEDNAYIAECFSRRRVTDVYLCTDEFITSQPTEKEELTKTTIKPSAEKEKVFIVHGRDETQALRLQKYLTKTLNIDAEMFEDFKERSGSNTIIEQLEYIKNNVGYAFVIVTPDDLGCLREDIDKCRTTMLIGRKSVAVKSLCEILDNLNSRARQNVVFEHGLFIGALGRDNVCCLLQKDTKEKPSDIDGILYVDFDKSVKETLPEITEKLKNAGLVKT